MSSNGAFVPLRTALDLRAHALAILVPGTMLDVSAGDALRAAVSLLFLAFLSWPIVVTAVAGAWLVFVKAGRPGWACLVPGYNLAQFLLLAKLPRRSWVLLLVPGVNIVLLVVACARLARAFRKGPGFAAGLVLLPPVYMTILGMSRARYRRFEVLPGTARKDIDTEPSHLARAEPAPAPTPEGDAPKRAIEPIRRGSGQPVLRLTRVSPPCTAGFRWKTGEARNPLRLASTTADEHLERRKASGSRWGAGEAPKSLRLASTTADEHLEGRKTSGLRWGAWGERRSLPPPEGEARKSVRLASEALGEHEERRKASLKRAATIERIHALEGCEDAHPPARSVSRASPPLHLV